MNATNRKKNDEAFARWLIKKQKQDRKSTVDDDDDDDDDDDELEARIREWKNTKAFNAFLARKKPTLMKLKEERLKAGDAVSMGSRSPSHPSASASREQIGVGEAKG